MIAPNNKVFHKALFFSEQRFPTVKNITFPAAEKLRGFALYKRGEMWYNYIGVLS